MSNAKLQQIGQEIIDLIQQYDPDDFFNDSDLEAWAERAGYKKEDE